MSYAAAHRDGLIFAIYLPIILLIIATFGAIYKNDPVNLPIVPWNATWVLDGSERQVNLLLDDCLPNKVGKTIIPFSKHHISSIDTLLRYPDELAREHSQSMLRPIVHNARCAWMFVGSASIPTMRKLLSLYQKDPTAMNILARAFYGKYPLNYLNNLEMYFGKHDGAWNFLVQHEGMLLQFHHMIYWNDINYIPALPMDGPFRQAFRESQYWEGAMPHRYVQMYHHRLYLNSCFKKDPINFGRAALADIINHMISFIHQPSYFLLPSCGFYCTRLVTKFAEYHEIVQQHPSVKHDPWVVQMIQLITLFVNKHMASLPFLENTMPLALVSHNQL